MSRGGAAGCGGAIGEEWWWAKDHGGTVGW